MLKKEFLVLFLQSLLALQPAGGRGVLGAPDREEALAVTRAGAHSHSRVGRPGSCTRQDAPGLLCGHDERHIPWFQTTEGLAPAWVADLRAGSPCAPDSVQGVHPCAWEGRRRGRHLSPGPSCPRRLPWPVPVTAPLAVTWQEQPPRPVHTGSADPVTPCSA